MILNSIFKDVVSVNADEVLTDANLMCRANHLPMELRLV